MKQSKNNSDLKEVFISLRLTINEKIQLEQILNDLGIENRTDFIKSCIFSKELKVKKTDYSMLELIKKLNNLQAEYRAIGNNYNQATKAIKTAFSEKKAFSFLYKLENETIELIKINKQIIQITKEFEEKWLQK